MDRALELARTALGWCSPNPAVGAVLVRDGQVVGEGHTQPPGSAHAEVMALRAAGEQARGASLYVTLEPCSHFGRTPPCTDALIAAGVAEVHAAMLDPSPWVSGQGKAALEHAGIPVHVGEQELVARRLNEAYLKWVATRRPFVTLKYAMTADGKSATRTGSSSWISGPRSRGLVARLRACVDAVLVGVDTVIADDPQLTARPEEFGPVAGQVHQPLRVVLDSRGRLPATARLVSGALPGQTLLVTTALASSSFDSFGERAGVEVLRVGQRDGRIDLDQVMDILGSRNIISVIAECGGTLAAGLLAQGCVDKVMAFVAPKIVGGMAAPTPVEGFGLPRMDAAIELVDPEWQVIDRDAVLTAYVAVDSPRLPVVDMQTTSQLVAGGR